MQSDCSNNVTGGQDFSSDSGELPSPPYRGAPASETLGELPTATSEDRSATIVVSANPTAAIRLLKKAIASGEASLREWRGDLAAHEEGASIAAAAIAETSRDLDDLRATLAQLEAQQ